MDTEPVEMTKRIHEAVETARRNMSEEEKKNEVRRIVHEFASYAVWHLSLTKPDHLAVRVLINKMLTDWINEEYVCGTKYCPYCRDDSARGFRHTFRRFVGRSERGRA